MIEWISKFLLGFFQKFLASFFQTKAQAYEKKIEQLRNLLIRFEDRSVPEIEVETAEELLTRAKGYIRMFKGESVSINGALLKPIERLIREIEYVKPRFWFRKP